MAVRQAPPSLGFSWQEHWSGLPFPSPIYESEKRKWSLSIMSDTQRSHGLQPLRLLCPWNFPGKSTGVGCHCLLCILSYKIAIFSRDKIKTYKETWGHPYERERVANNQFYHMVHKKEEGTYHPTEKLTREMPGFLRPGRGLPLLLIPEYSGINKEQRIPDRSKTAPRKPPVKCFLTIPPILLYL